MADMSGKPTAAALALLITSSPATAGVRASHVPLRFSYVSGGAGSLGHAHGNTWPSQTLQPSTHPFGWTLAAPPLSNGPRPLPFPALHLAPPPQLPVIQPPSDRAVVGAGTPSNGGIARAPPPARPSRHHTTTSSAPPPPAALSPPRARRLLPVPDKSLEEFLIERGVLDAVPPCGASPAAAPGVVLGAAGPGRAEPAGEVNGARGGGARSGWPATSATAGLGAGAASGSRQLGRAAAAAAKERRRRRLAKNREAAAKARAQRLAASRGGGGGTRSKSER